MGKTTAEILIRANADFSQVKTAVNQLGQWFNNVDTSKLSKNVTQGLTTSLKDAQGAIDKTEKLLSGMTASGKFNTSDAKKYSQGIKEINTAANQFSRIFNNIDPNVLAKAIKIDPSKLDGIKDITTSIEQIKQSIADVNTNNISNISKQLEGLGSTMPKTQTAIKQMMSDLSSGNIDQAAEGFNKINANINRSISYLEAQIEKQKELKEAALAQDKNADTSQYDKVISNYEQLIGSRKELQSTLSQSINDQAIVELQTQLQELQKKFDLVIQKAREAGVVLGNDVVGEFKKAGEESKKTGDGFKAMADDSEKAQHEIDQLLDRFARFTSLAGVFDILRRSIRSAFSDVKELDKAMNSIAVVTNYTTSQLWGQIDKYSSIAKSTGSTIKGVYEVATLYYQQGLSTEEVMKASTETLKLARIAGLEYADATNYMTAALNGFNMSVEQASHVNDVYSNLAANTASSQKEIAVAMTKVASLANSVNASFENTSAFLSQIIATTRESAETAGTALKTVFARFAEVKKLYTEGQLTGTDEEGAEIDINKIDTALKTAGLSLNKFILGEEGLDDVMLKLAEKWDTLSVAQQRYIATQAAGSRQQSRFLALMNDYQGLIDKQDLAINSAGKSQEQFNKTLDSLESKLNNLKTAWTEFTTGIANSDLIKWAVDTVTNILTSINSITDKFDGLGKSIANLLVLFGSLRGAGAILKSIAKVAGVSLFGMGGGDGATKAASGIFSIFQKGAFIKNIGEATEKLSLFSSKIPSVGAGISKLGQTLKLGGKAFASFGKAALSSLAALGPYIAIAAAVALVIVGIVNAVNAEKQALENANKAIESTSKVASEAKTKLEELQNNFDALIESEDKLDNLTEGTQEWYDALYDVNEKVLELLNNYPELAQYLTSQNGRLGFSSQAKDDIQAIYQEKARNAAESNLNAQIYQESLQKKVDIKSYEQIFNKKLKEFGKQLNLNIISNFKETDGTLNIDKLMKFQDKIPDDSSLDLLDSFNNVISAAANFNQRLSTSNITISNYNKAIAALTTATDGLTTSLGGTLKDRLAELLNKTDKTELKTVSTNMLTGEQFVPIDKELAGKTIPRWIARNIAKTEGENYLTDDIIERMRAIPDWNRHLKIYEDTQGLYINKLVNLAVESGTTTKEIAADYDQTTLSSLIVEKFLDEEQEFKIKKAAEELEKWDTEDQDKLSNIFNKSGFTTDDIYSTQEKFFNLSRDVKEFLDPGYTSRNNAFAQAQQKIDNLIKENLSYVDKFKYTSAEQDNVPDKFKRTDFLWKFTDTQLEQYNAIFKNLSDLKIDPSLFETFDTLLFDANPEDYNKIFEAFDLVTDWTDKTQIYDAINSLYGIDGIYADAGKNVEELTNYIADFTKAIEKVDLSKLNSQLMSLAKISSDIKSGNKENGKLTNEEYSTIISSLKGKALEDFKNNIVVDINSSDPSKPDYVYVKNIKELAEIIDQNTFDSIAAAKIYDDSRTAIGKSFNNSSDFINAYEDVDGLTYDKTQIAIIGALQSAFNSGINLNDLGLAAEFGIGATSFKTINDINENTLANIFNDNEKTDALFNALAAFYTQAISENGFTQAQKTTAQTTGQEQRGQTYLDQYYQTGQEYQQDYLNGGLINLKDNEYAQYVYEELDETVKQLTIDEKAQDAVQIALASGTADMAKEIEDVNDAYDKNKEALKDVNKNSDQYKQALKKLKKEIKEAYGVDVSEDWIDANKDLIDSMDESEEAYNRFIEALAKEAGIDEFINKLNEANIEVNNVSDLITQLGDSGAFNIDGTATINTNPFLESLDSAFRSGAIGADEFAAIMASLGYVVTYGPKDENGIPTTVSYKRVGGGGSKGYSGSKGGGGGGGGKTSQFQNKEDWLYNLLEEIAETTRDIEKLQAEEKNLLKDGTTSKSLAANRSAQIANLQEKKALQQLQYTRRQQEMSEYQSTKSKYSEYAWWDEGRQEVQIDWDKINAISDEDKLKEVEDYLSGLEDIQKKLDDAEDDVQEIQDQIDELLETWKQEYVDYLNKVKDALVQYYQDQIDEYTDLNETLNDTNSKILDAIQKEINLERQIRDNTRTEKDINDAQARLGFLSMDTSGGNQLEILQLQDQLEDQRESYTDTLIDQALERLQDNEDTAQQQREHQIEIMQAQLNWAQENGELWNEINGLINDAMSPEGGLLKDSQLESILRNADNYEAMSDMERELWNQDDYEEFNKALSWPNIEESNMKYVDKSLQDIYNRIPDSSVVNVYNSSGGGGGGGGGGAGPAKQENHGYQIINKNTNKVTASNSGYATVNAAKAAMEQVLRALAGTGSYSYKYYKTGGLNTTTGPAWLDGTPSKPEYVLNAAQTEAFLKLADVLPSVMRGSTNSSTTKYGDLNLTIDMHVDEIASDYDVNNIADRVKEIIYENSTYRNINALSFTR